VEPKYYEALHRIFSGPRAIAGTLQAPPSKEAWRERLAEPPEGLYSLVGCVEGEVVGNLGLHTSPLAGVCGTSAALVWPCARTGRARASRTALMEAALDLAYDWLNLTRSSMRVYVENAEGMAFRSAKDLALGSSKSLQNKPLTSGIPSSLTTTRTVRILYRLWAPPV
jgi:putative acetyltransferase